MLKSVKNAVDKVVLKSSKERSWIPLSQLDPDCKEQGEDTSEEQASGDTQVMSWFSQAEKDPFLPSLSKRQRIIGFFIFLSLGIFCFGMAGLLMPFLLLKARKFVLLYTLGSVFSIGSFSLLWGPVNHVKHLCSFKRLPFTLAYLGTMFATLYAALAVLYGKFTILLLLKMVLMTETFYYNYYKKINKKLKKTLITIIFATLQIVALIWYVFSYVPGGTTGLKFFTKLCASACQKTVSSALPV